MADDTSLRVESLSEESDNDGDEALATRSDEVKKTNDEIQKGSKINAKRPGGIFQLKEAVLQIWRRKMGLNDEKFR